MFLLLIRFVRFIRFNRLYTKPYPNPTVFIKLYPFGLYGIYQNQTILSISVRFGTVRFGFAVLNGPNYYHHWCQKAMGLSAFMLWPIIYTDSIRPKLLKKMTRLTALWTRFTIINSVKKQISVPTTYIYNTTESSRITKIKKRVDVSPN